jgi:release factor glutamine methyltransferase
MRGNSRFKVQGSRFKVQSEEKLRLSPALQESQGGRILQLTAADLLSRAVAELTEHGVLTPRLDAEVLLAHALRISRAGLYSRLHEPPPAGTVDAFSKLLRRRARHEPLHYITGVREFWSLEFTVDPQVLIPRPETEVVVETALQLFSQSAIRNRQSVILDVGTGSGCIAITLAKELPQAEVWAADISPDALRIARENARHHSVAARIRFLQGDLFLPVAEKRGSFDLIIANPPYVAQSELATLQPEVRDWEPPLALDGGLDGLDFYRRLLCEGPTYLRAGGWLVMEIGHGQGKAVLRLAREQPDLSDGRCVCDYAGQERVIVACRGATCVN